MSPHETVDLAKVVVILGSFVGVNDILKLSENSRYEFRPPPGNTSTSWKGDQARPNPPFVALTIGEHLYDPRGWVLGSDPDSDECDLQLAETNQTGISRRFIRIDISPATHNPRVTVLSDITIRIRDGDRILPCTPGKPQEFLHPVTIDLGAVSFRAWPPIRSTQETRTYKQHAKKFSEDILRAVPKYVPSIKNHPATAKHNVRYGKDDAVYVNELGIQSKGTGASVMMVTDRSTGKVFGAKEPYYAINDGHDAARKRLEAIQQEYRHIMKLDHPHIVKAYDLVLAEDVTLPPWMIVEYIPLNLRDILMDLDEHNKPMVLTHLASALQYIHSENITHRDVKPDNVLIQKQDEELTVKLADFGTSIYNAVRKMDTFTGTEMYMAPELFHSPRRYTDKVDMWSLGLIGVQLFSNWDPAADDGWNPSDFGPWMRKVILPRIEEAPEQFRPLLKALLRKNPNRRWSAQRCLIWLWKYQDDNAPDDKGPINSRKRSTSKLDEPLLNRDDRERRQQRSPNPSLSTARARAVPHAEQHSEGESSLPDTLSPGAWEPEPFSTALTPTPDDGLSDFGDVEAEDGSSDSDLEDDWREDEDQDGRNE